MTAQAVLEKLGWVPFASCQKYPKLPVVGTNINPEAVVPVDTSVVLVEEITFAEYAAACHLAQWEPMFGGAAYYKAVAE
jgi:hypothetical protein